MRQYTVTHTVYRFDELSDTAKEQAILSLYDINVDHEWWDCTYEDAKNIGLEISSFELDRASYVKGNFTLDATVIASRILADHGESCETYKTALNYLEDYKSLELYQDEYELEDAMLAINDEFLYSLCEDYRIILEKEYEYLTSDESIIETIEANEYEFYSDGTLA